VQVVALVLALALLLPPASCLADDGAVCFPTPVADRLLAEVESCRDELPTLRALDEKNAALDEIRKEREELLRERIAFLEKQQGELMRMNDQAIKYGEEARKAAGGSWWEKAFNVGKWIGLGLLLGLAIGGS
jgi:hypothetical protein